MQAFRKYLNWWYQQYGRHDLPWRDNYHPYNVLVSELMLQQTQVERVIPKYHAFMQQFPTIETLRQAPLRDVLVAWQGLGYNRRAKYLHQTAMRVSQMHGKFPKTQAELKDLPGIGEYTASAIMAFSYNQPVRIIETNIRTVFIYHFFPQQDKVSDSELEPLIEESLDRNNPRQWYSALMDYGTVLKKHLPNPSRRSKHHSKQSKFVGSIRQTRGEILRELVKVNFIDEKELFSKLKSKEENHQIALEQLISERLVFNDSGKLQLAE